MGFLDIIKTQETKKEDSPKNLKDSVGGKGKKQCCQCRSYVGVRTKICNCGYDFETKSLGLFATVPEQKDLIKRLGITNENIVQWVLMCSYIYYCKNDCLIPDEDYDKLHSILKDNWKTVQHRHKFLIKEECLDNNSLHYLSQSEYPQIIQHSALRFLKAMKKYKATIENVVEKKLYNLVAFNEVIF
jgi:hypothetical protein